PVLPLALAAREVGHALLRVAPLAVERGDVGARRHRPAAEREHVGAARDLLPDRLLGVEGVAALVHVGELHGLTDPERARVGLLLADDHPEQRRLARAVRPDDTDDPATGELEREVVDEQDRKSTRLNSSHVSISYAV